CTLDLCSPEGCQFMNTTNPCDDGNACTTQDTCSPFTGDCNGGPSANCNDDNPCTTDMCVLGQGCVHLYPEIKCDDKNDCNGQDNDWCIGGICQNVGADYTSCDDQNPCTTDSCDQVGGGGCSHEFNNAPCNDNNPCTQNDICMEGVCGSTDLADCDDGNPCTDDTCTEIGCIHEYNTAPCNDDNECTVGDSCFNGVCGSELLTCEDDNPCTDDDCDENIGCVFNPVAPCCGNGAVEGGENCDDGNFNDGDGCNNDCIIEDCPPGTAQVEGLCWVHALNWDPVNSAHQAACASIGKSKTNTNVTMNWNEDTLAKVAVALGYTSIGDYSDSAHGMWCNNDTMQCGTHNFGGYFENYGPYPNNWWWGHGCCHNGNNNCGWWGWWGNPNYNQNCWHPDHNWLPIYTCYP
ncbi:MAG: hypothetical protein VX938_05925, partial [Myxococcota bacterium]|nr:hypothetical protein [Myxococcota bacterium]